MFVFRKIQKSFLKITQIHVPVNGVEEMTKINKYLWPHFDIPFLKFQVSKKKRSTAGKGSCSKAVIKGIEVIVLIDVELGIRKSRNDLRKEEQRSESCPRVYHYKGNEE